MWGPRGLPALLPQDSFPHPRRLVSEVSVLRSSLQGPGPFCLWLFTPVGPLQPACMWQGKETAPGGIYGPMGDPVGPGPESGYVRGGRGERIGPPMALGTCPLSHVVCRRTRKCRCRQYV